MIGNWNVKDVKFARTIESASKKPIEQKSVSEKPREESVSEKLEVSTILKGKVRLMDQGLDLEQR